MERPEDDERVAPGRGLAGEEWSIDSDVVAERMGGEIVLVHLRTNKIYELNGTAARIFELMRQGAGRGELEEALRREYAVEPRRLAASLERLLGELSAAGILR